MLSLATTTCSTSPLAEPSDRPLLAALARLNIPNAACPRNDLANRTDTSDGPGRTGATLHSPIQCEGRMSLSVSFNLPPEVEDRLRRESRDLNTDVKEAFALELFRRGTLSDYELSQILALDRFETDAWLKRHGVFEGSPTVAEVDEDRRTLDRVTRKAG